MDQIIMIVLVVIPAVFAITVHEAAHGYVANALGDSTAKSLGRLTLNPIKHIDPIGTVVVPLVLYAIGGFMFGWAKPVPVDTRNFKSPSVDMALVAAAGPLSNLVMAIAWALLLALGIENNLVQGMALAGISINVVLFALNVLPIPPLDGSKIVAHFLPYSIRRTYEGIEQYGLIILLVLMATGVLGVVLRPMVQNLSGLLFRLVGLG
jgi:Zn-dependent protease